MMDFAFCGSQKIIIIIIITGADREEVRVKEEGKSWEQQRLLGDGTFFFFFSEGNQGSRGVRLKSIS